MWKLLLPAILIIIGISIIFKDIIGSNIKKEIKKINNNNKSEYCATFSGRDINLNDEEFTGATINAIFGGINLDLRNAKIKENQVIIDKLNVLSSTEIEGVDIYVPENIKVKVNSTSIFGGVSDKKQHSIDDKAKTIYINASCIFGGVEIK